MSRPRNPMPLELSQGGAQCKWPWVGREATWYCVLDENHTEPHGYDRISGRCMAPTSAREARSERAIQAEIAESFND